MQYCLSGLSSIISRGGWYYAKCIQIRHKLIKPALALDYNGASSPSRGHIVMRRQTTLVSVGSLPDHTLSQDAAEEDKEDGSA